MGLGPSDCETLSPLIVHCFSSQSRAPYEPQPARLAWLGLVGEALEGLH